MGTVLLFCCACCTVFTCTKILICRAILKKRRIAFLASLKTNTQEKCICNKSESVSYLFLLVLARNRLFCRHQDSSLILQCSMTYRRSKCLFVVAKNCFPITENELAEGKNILSMCLSFNLRLHLLLVGCLLLMSCNPKTFQTM